ncbi:MAG: T9SS type A sorting domain-containing protein [Gelidibacter sp.]
MKQKLLFLFFLTVSFSYSQELLIIDLSTENQVTITATTGTSAATVTGPDATGVYFENFFSNAGTQTLTNVLVSGNITTPTTTSDGSPSIFRGSGTDPGLNMWSYATESNSPFTAGEQAFTGQGTWTLSAAEYAAFLTAPANGNLYFPADTVDDLTATTPPALIGTYTVTFPLSVDEAQVGAFSYHPNPVNEVLHISSPKPMAQVAIYNMLGQNLKVQTINSLSATVDTANLATGTYVFRAYFQDGTSNTMQIAKR